MRRISSASGQSFHTFNTAEELSSVRPLHCGFTLIELVAVIAVIATLAVLVFPLLPSSDATNLRCSARQTASLLRYLEDQAVSNKNRLRLHLNISEGMVQVMRVTSEGDEAQPDDPFLKQQPLAQGVTVSDVVTQRQGKMTEGEMAVDIGVAGLTDLLVIHLKSHKDQYYTVVAYPWSPKVKVLEGYREEVP